MQKQLRLTPEIAMATPLYHYFAQDEITRPVREKVQQLADILTNAKQIDSRINTSNLTYVG